ncbi:MAG: hypothetical protein FJX66_00355 [Alphaproteobacteria bacterium]|nr:hypothetical protein [Alphaproteobacteria bacterium]
MLMFACAALLPPSFIVAGARCLGGGLVATQQETEDEMSIPTPPRRSDRRDMPFSTSTLELDAACWHRVITSLTSSDRATRSNAATFFREYLAAAFDRPDIAAQIRARGVTLGEAKARVGRLSDATLSDLAATVDAGDGRSEPGRHLAAVLLEPFARVVAAVLLLPFSAILAVLGVTEPDPVTDEEGWLR